MLHHHDSTKKQIIGRKFLSAEKRNDHTIQITCEDGSFSVGVEGDCCSQSVFYDLVIPPECIGEEILDVIEHDSNPHPEEKEVYKMGFGGDDDYGFEVASIWDITLLTKNGKILLRHANNSNGYYDGMTYYNFN